MMHRFLLIILVATGMFSQRTIDKIIAVIGDRIITKQDVDFALKQLQMQNPQFDPVAKRGEVLDYLINENLLVIKAEIDSVEINEEYVDQNANRQWSNLVGRAGGEAQIEAAYNLPAKKIRKKIRKNVRDKMATEMLSNKFRAKLKVSREEVVSFFNAHKDSLPDQPEQVEIARFLMFPSISDDAMKVVQEKVDKALERIKNGEDFAELAKELSEGPSGPNGGYLGKVKLGGGFVKEYEDGAMALDNPGDISGPVQSPFGIHIIKLHSKTRDEFETSHILFMAQATDADAQVTVEKMAQFRSDIKAGNTTFKDIVRKHSEDKATNTKDGYLGIFTVSQLPDEDIKNRIALLSEGELSDPFIKDEGGKKAIQILKLIDRIEAHKFALETDYSSIEQMALRKKQSIAFDELLKELKSEIPIIRYN